LWPSGEFLARNDVPARIRAGSLRDPDLPIDILRPKGKVVAFNAMNYTASEVFDVVDLWHQLLVRI
jgi:hypothetical protein